MIFNLFEHRLSKWIPEQRRHRWFRGMGSSQALAVSVFSIFFEREGVAPLATLPDDCGDRLLPDFAPAGTPIFDRRITTLHELAYAHTAVDL